MFLEKSLQNLGLTEKEAKIYLAALELGDDTVQNIAKKAGIKRPTAYIIIDELIKMGILIEKVGYKGNSYVAENPEKLKIILQEKQRSFSEALPFLQAIYSEEKSKPQIKIYEGVEGMKRIYLDTIWKCKTEILFFSSIKKTREVMPELFDKWLENLTNKNVGKSRKRELVNHDFVDIKYGRQVERLSGGTTEVRVLPKNSLYKFVGTDNAIFEDKIMMVSFEDKLFTTLIQSQVLANTMRALFDLAWQSAIPIIKFVKNHKVK